MNNDWKAFLSEAGAEYQADALLHFGNPECEREVALSGLVFADLDYMGVLAVRGKDAPNFLQSQLSNDLRNCDESTSQLSCYCTPKGRTLGLMRIFRQADTYYMRLPADTIEAVQARLRMYVMRASVEIEDVSDRMIRLGVSGAEADAEIRSLCGAVPGTVNQVLQQDGLVIIRVPGSVPRYEIYTQSLQLAGSCWDSLNVRGAPVGSPAWRLLEIQAGLPCVFSATSELFVPQMLNLQLVDGLSFKKGCFPGQEIVARMQYLGTLKRRMYLGRIQQDEAILPGEELFESSAGEQSCGRLVDAQPHPDGGHLALAVVQTRSASESLHLGEPHGPAFVFEPLPYAFED